MNIKVWQMKKNNGNAKSVLSAIRNTVERKAHVNVSEFLEESHINIINVGFLFCKSWDGSGSFLGQSMFAADEQALIDFLREHPDGDFPRVITDSIK